VRLECLRSVRLKISIESAFLIRVDCDESRSGGGGEGRQGRRIEGVNRFTDSPKEPGRREEERSRTQAYELDKYARQTSRGRTRFQFG